MSKAEKLSVAFEALLGLEEVVLLDKQAEVAWFLETDHKSKKTKDYQKEMRTTELHIGYVLQLTKHVQRKVPEFKEAGMEFCARLEELKAQAQSIRKDLAEDLIERRQTEDMGKVDFIKSLGFIITSAAAAGTVSKIICGVSTPEAMHYVEAATFIAVGVAFAPQISATFKMAARTACKLTEQEGGNKIALKRPYKNRQNLRKHVL